MDEIVNLWENLVTASGQKGSKLREAAQQQQFNRTVEDIELWLSEVEGQLLSEDYGKVFIYFFYLYYYTLSSESVLYTDQNWSVFTYSRIRPAVMLPPRSIQ